MISLTKFHEGNLRKDVRFIEEGIVMSNTSKKQTQIERESTKVEKKVKNLRHFLKQKRGITLKSAPTSLKKKEMNKTYIGFKQAHEEEEKNGNERQIFWTVELYFKKEEERIFVEQISENSKIMSWLKKEVLLKQELRDEDRLVISSALEKTPKVEYEGVFSESLAKELEEGEIEERQEKRLVKRRKEVDLEQSLREVLQDAVVFEVPSLTIIT